jgi:hypothetical protein
VQLNNYIDWIASRDLDSWKYFDNDYIVNVANSPKYPVYDIDYGWGKPLNVQFANINKIGEMVLFPGRDGGSIDLSTLFPRHHMETLKRILMSRANA